MAQILAWHWLPSDAKLANRDGRPVVVGETLSVTPPLVICTHGLHASRRIIDSLQYAPGTVVCRVRCEGSVIEQSDKLCCEHRTVLAMADATTLLHEFACDIAEEALKRERANGREPDARCWAAIEAKRRWLRGEISDAELDAARDAVWTAARDAARDAAWTAARTAARDAARDAVWTAARDAAWTAARTAARDAQNARLETAVRKLLGPDVP